MIIQSYHPGLLLLSSRLGNLTSLIKLLNRLDNTNSHSLPHVPNSEPTKGRVLLEGLYAHGLGRHQLDNGGVTGLDLAGVVLHLLTRPTVDLLQKLGELAGGVGVQHGGVALLDLTGVVQDDDLGVEGNRLLGGVVLGVGGDVAPPDVLDGDVLDVEADVVAWDTLGQGLVVHLDGLDLSGDVGGGKGDDHAGLDDTGLDSADGHCADTADLVDVLEGQPQGLVGGPGRGDDGVKSLEEGLTIGV